MHRTKKQSNNGIVGKFRMTLTAGKETQHQQGTASHTIENRGRKSEKGIYIEPSRERNIGSLAGM